MRAILDSVASMTEAEQREVARHLASRLPGERGPAAKPADAPVHGDRANGDAPDPGAWVWGGSFILKTPGVIGGDACIRRTRIPVWLLVRHKQLGHDEAAMLDDYPGLTRADLDAAWAYYRERTEEVENAIAEQEREDD